VVVRYDVHKTEAACERDAQGVAEYANVAVGEAYYGQEVYVVMVGGYEGAPYAEEEAGYVAVEAVGGYAVLVAVYVE
jgi:hypothetical protein